MKSNKAFTLVELIIVIAIILVLVGLLLPGLYKALDQAKKVNCQSQLKQLYAAIELYSQSYDSYYPYIDNNQPDNQFVGFRAALGDFVDTSENRIFKCTNPASDSPTDAYYFYNNEYTDNFPTNPDVVSEETGTSRSLVYIFTCRSGYKDGSPAEFYPHSHGVNVLYSDGHVDWEKK